MSNLKSLKEITGDFGGKYEGGIKVILESEEDVCIFRDHWFDQHQDKIRFESAEEGKSGGGGCKAVLQMVENARNKQLAAFGIIDRDVLLADKKPDIFWETDDEKFHTAKPYGDYIHVLRRWELENYLLKPQAFSAVLAHRVSRPPAPTVTSQTLLNLEDDLMDVTALTTFMVGKQYGSPSTRFSQSNSGQALRNDIENYLKTNLPGVDYGHLAADRERIKAFAENEQEPENRWDKLNRAVDGKKAFDRICGYLSTTHNIKSLLPWEEMRGSLADRIASLELVDGELRDAVERFARANYN